MRNSTKGTLAASAAAVLLLGGFGTHAAWSSGKDVTGTDIATGHLKLLAVSCGDWHLTVDGITSTTAYDVASDLMVPGNLLTRTCRFEVDAAGAVKATLSASLPSVMNGNVAVNDLTVAAAFADTTGSPISGTTQLADGQLFDAKVTVSMPVSGATPSSQDLQATLDAVTVTATQA